MQGVTGVYSTTERAEGARPGRSRGRAAESPGRAERQSRVSPSSQDVCPRKEHGACCQLPQG